MDRLTDIQNCYTQFFCERVKRRIGYKRVEPPVHFQLSVIGVPASLLVILKPSIKNLKNYVFH